MDGLSSVKRKLLAVDCLKALKEEKTFRVLSDELKLPIGVINRYVNGYVLPREERAKDIIDSFYKNNFKKMIDTLSVHPDSKYRVTISILTNNFLLSLIAYRVHQQFDTKLDKVFTAAADGIALAVKLADEYSCRAIYSKKSREITQGGLLASRTPVSSPRSVPLYLPENLLSRRDDVLIVDDVIRTGETIDALYDLCKQSRARVAGIFGLFMTTEAKAKLEECYQCPIHALEIIKDT